MADGISCPKNKKTHVVHDLAPLVFADETLALLVHLSERRDQSPLLAQNQRRQPALSIFPSIYSSIQTGKKRKTRERERERGKKDGHHETPNVTVPSDGAKGWQAAASAVNPTWVAADRAEREGAMKRYYAYIFTRTQ